MAQNELMHYGIKGMKWGVRRKRDIPTSLTANKSDSAITKRVKNDYNTLSDNDFMAKYKTSKKTYAKRVEKYGDPYKHRVNSKSYKNLVKVTNSKPFKALTKTKSYNARLNYVTKKLANNESKAAAKKAALKGAKKVTDLMTKVGMYYITDQLFWGGMGTKITKEAVKYTGRAVITAYMKSRGAWDIHWYDN